ncbi:unnamed protein product [Closterium sp. NIES-54]
MASLRVLAFDHEGRLIQFDTWLDDLQLYLLSDSKDSVSLFDLASGPTPAPPTTADSATRSQWLNRDAAARLAIQNHLPLTECAHFGQHKTAHALYDAVVACYSSPANTSLGRLLLPYLFPELSAFATVEDLVSHLCASDARYRAIVPTELLDRNPPPMFITLYFIVTRLPDSLRSVKDHFLSLDPTSLTGDLLENHLLATETSAVVVGAARGTQCTPFFEGCSPSPLDPSYASAATADVPSAENIGAASASGKHCSSKGKGGKGGGGGSRSGDGGSNGVVEAVEVVAVVGLVAGVGVLVAVVEATVGVAVDAAVGPVAVGLELGVEVPEVASGSSSSVKARPSRPSSFMSGCFSMGRLGVVIAARMSFAQVTELVTHAGGFTLSTAASPSSTTLGVLSLVTRSSALAGKIFLAAAALGASESGTLPDTAPSKALHSFMLDSIASRCFFRDSTTLTPLPAPVPVRLANSSKGPVVARSSTVLPCPTVLTAALQDAMVTTTTPWGQRVSNCTCTRTGRHQATFTRRPGSILYILATEPPQVAASAQVSASGQVAPPCSCHLLSHQTLLWHHRLGHPSLPRLRGMHSHLLVSPSPPALACPALPSLRRGAAARRSSLLLLSPDDCSPADSPHGLCLQLREQFRVDLPILRLHADRGGEFSSDLLREFCRGEGILQTFTRPDSPQRNGIAERRIGLVMEVARTSMIHVAAPHFLWPFPVRYAAHELNLWPCVSFLETSPTLCCTGKVGDASVFLVWGSRAFVRDTSAD